MDVVTVFDSAAPCRCFVASDSILECWCWQCCPSSIGGVGSALRQVLVVLTCISIEYKFGSPGVSFDRNVGSFDRWNFKKWS
ncbi:hypothetical protein Pmani_000383 [Petrolisthes manimaculis]|uniref:Uncharacterized protein n=1 Tax=Petrolisthes manimaculis TaxID=1843537 RepID=A0AAE1QLS8_9EUCA|nr:hypothetical protein Pmani_000383 [Petrolisthes manimaculis]